LFPYFATGGKFAAVVVDTGGNLQPVSLPLPNLPLVSTTLAKLVTKFEAGVVNIGGKFLPVWLILAAILPPVSLTPVANCR
jgi:hypothetical protein